jgi:hypothetical protein
VVDAGVLIGDRAGFRQRRRRTGIRATPEGMKKGRERLGRERIPAASGRQRKEKIKMFSTACAHLWKPSKQG